MNYLKKSLMLILVCSLMACATMKAPQKDLTIEEIKGAWEGLFPLFIGYCRLEINQEGKGYFIIVFKEDDVEVFKIESISIIGKEIEIRIKDTSSDTDELVKLNGVVWSDRIYFEIMPDKDAKEKQDTMKILLLREGSFNRFRTLAIDKLNKLKD